MPKVVKKSKPIVKQPSPSLVWYRRIAVTFVTVTFLTLAIVVYLSFSRATVHIASNTQMIENDFVADVVAVATSPYETEGKILNSVFEQASEMILSSDGASEVEAKAGGLVTIINNYSSDQPLVATTRLLTADGILFRIDENVNVPAGGSVQVMAHADVPGKSGEIAPSHFTIPGLSESLQKLIYAESSQTMVGGVAYVRVVTEEDLQKAADDLREQILSAAKESLRLEAGNSYDGEVFYEEILEKKSDTEPGVETDRVIMSMKLKVVGVFFQKNNLVQIAKKKVYEDLEKGLDLVDFNEDDVSYEVTRYDLENQIANIDVKVNTLAMLSATNELLDPDLMLGKSPAEVKASLEASPIIESVSISFTPFWLQRMPTLKDHIKIVIE